VSALVPVAVVWTTTMVFSVGIFCSFVDTS
jgi:hypothetical protein